MDVYKVKHFFRNVFLICSSILAISMPIIGTSETIRSNYLVGVIFGKILGICWLASFAFWIIFLAAGLKPGRLGKIIKIVLTAIVIFTITFFLAYLYVLRPHKTTGLSMKPYFVPGEYILSEKVTYAFRSLKRGNVIVFTPPISPGDHYFARIIGLPGEYISIKNGHININGKVLEEPYLAPDVKTAPGPSINETNVLIPDGEYAILGDNREHSNDSRYYGFVSKNSIIGRIFYVYWPPEKSGFIQAVNY
jgi:signal peptidase I